MSAASLAVFLALVAFVAVALVGGVWVSGSPLPARTRARQTVGVGVGLAVWMGATAILARSGCLADFDAVPPPAALVLAALLAGTLMLAFSPLGRRLAHGAPLAALVGVQAFRIPLELLLHQLYAEGIVPVQVTYEGWNYDMATGLLALALAGAMARTNVPRAWLVAWNVLGLVLVAVVVGTAVLSLPTPFQRFTSEPSTAAVVTTVPLIWLPSVLVQGALLGHVLVFRRLFGTAPTR